MTPARAAAERWVAGRAAGALAREMHGSLVERLEGALAECGVADVEDPDTVSIIARQIVREWREELRARGQLETSEVR